MEAKDLVRRQIDDNDRRAKRVYLTAEVEPLVQTMRTIAAEMRRDALFGLSRSDREQFVDSLITIKANLARLNESGASKSATPKGGTSR
jgi:MarR family transcriptional regulator for hemolysin